MSGEQQVVGGVTFAHLWCAHSVEVTCLDCAAGSPLSMCFFSHTPGSAGMVFALGKPVAGVAPSVDDAPDDDNGDESQLGWARAATTHSASAPAPPCPSGTPALADAVARDIHDPDHIAEILCIGADEVLEFHDLLEDEQDVIAEEAQSEPPEDAEDGESLPAGDTGGNPLEVCKEEAGDEPCEANSSVTPVVISAIPANHATPTTSAAPHFWPRKHGAHVGRDGNAARAAEDCRLLPLSCARHRLRGSAPPMWVRPPELRGCAAHSRRSHDWALQHHVCGSDVADNMQVVRIAKILAQVGANVCKYHTSNAAGILCKKCDKWLQVKVG